jgi:phage-related baseplate assembly protein
MPTPTIAFADLINPVPASDVERSVYRVLESLGLNTSTWKTGAVVRTVTTAFSIVTGAMSTLQALIARSGYLELSEHEWLTIVSHHVYAVDRYEATFASGFVTLTNTAGGVYEFDPEDLIFSDPTTGKSFRNTAAVSIPAGSTTMPTHVIGVPIRAVEAGSASSSAAEAISVMVTTVTGVTVSNPLALAGQDAESDAALRTRCSAKLGSLSPMGPWDAYTYAVRSATRPADGSNLGITRTRIAKDGYGNVAVYVATASGAVVPEDVVIAQAAVEKGAEPYAITAVVDSAEAVDLPVTYEAWIYETTVFTDAQIKSAIQTNLRAWVSAQPIGGDVIGGGAGKIYAGKIYADRISAEIGGTFPEIFHVVVGVPAADVALTLNQVATLGAVDGVIHRVPPP